MDEVKNRALLGLLFLMLGGMFFGVHSIANAVTISASNSCGPGSCANNSFPGGMAYVDNLVWDPGGVGADSTQMTFNSSGGSRSQTCAASWPNFTCNLGLGWLATWAQWGPNGGTKNYVDASTLYYRYCSPASVANGSVANPPDCSITCNANYYWDGSNCSLIPCSPSSIANGSVGPPPNCTKSCNAGYAWNGSYCALVACNPSSVVNGTVAPAPNCAITCNAGYTRSGNSCIDVTAPTLSVSRGAVAPWFNTNNGAITASFSDTGSGLNLCWYKTGDYNGSIWTYGTWKAIPAANCTGASGSYPLNFTAGYHALMLEAQDKAGNLGYGPSSINWYYYNIDLTPPTAVVSPGNPGAAYNTATPFTYTATWADVTSGLATCQINIDGTWYVQSCSGASGSYSGSFAAGAHAIILYDTDLAGNTYTSPTYTYNGTPPPPTVTIKANGVAVSTAVTYNTPATLTWTSTNASTCTGMNFGTGGATATTTGVSTGNLYGTQTYSISCGGPMSSFAPKVDYTTGSGPLSIAIGDLNGDGKPDLAVTNYSANTVSVFINNGAGAFASKVDYATGVNPRSVAIGDVTGDGKADLAVANYTSNTVSVLKNNGTGTFAAKVDYATGANPFSVAIGDVTGDGKADLAVANYTSNTVSVLKNNGIGTFAAKVDYATGTNPRSVAIGDLNGDGKADLAVANYNSNSASVLINNGTGTFAARVNYVTGTGPNMIAIGDLNGDGKADLAVANYTGNTASVLINNGTGTFAAKVDYATGTGPFSIAIGDLSGDNNADLAVANYGAGVGNTASVLINNGGGTFATKVDYTTGTGPSSIAIGDLNGDSKPDLATANYAAGTTASVFLNNSNGVTATSNVVVHVNPVYGSCSANACVLNTGIEGQTYTNLCSNNAMTASYCGGSGGGGGSGGSWHSVCANNACIVVNGAGTNQCSSNLDCSGSYPAQYYGACAQGTCVMVSGTDAYATSKGISSCSNYGGSCPNPAGSSYNINASDNLKLSITKKSGTTCSANITLTIEPLSGFSDTVNLSILDWGGLATYSPTANFSQTSLTSVQYSSGATLNVCAPTSAASNNYTITVRGVGASSGKTIDRQLQVILHNIASSTWQEI